MEHQNKEFSFKDWIKKFVINKIDFKNQQESKKEYKIFLNVKKILY